MVVVLKLDLAVSSATIHKIRFPTRQEFWSFVAHIAFSRVHADNGWCNEPTRGVIGVSSMGEHHMSDE